MIVDVYTTNTHYGQRQAANTPLLAVDRREVKRLVRSSRSHLGLGRPDLRRLRAALVAAGDADTRGSRPRCPATLGTVTVSTPASSLAATRSTSAPAGIRNQRQNRLAARSARMAAPEADAFHDAAAIAMISLIEVLDCSCVRWIA